MKDRDLDVLLIWRRSDPNEVEQLSNEKEGHLTAHADDPGSFAASLVRAAFLRLYPTGFPSRRSERRRDVPPAITALFQNMAFWNRGAALRAKRSPPWRTGSA
jgi:hypothetical protein